MTNAWRATPMSVRPRLTDAAWAEMEPMLTTRQNNAGRPPEWRDR